MIGFLSKNLFTIKKSVYKLCLKKPVSPYNKKKKKMNEIFFYFISTSYHLVHLIQL
jgi:hypothetical protein